jgi:hypothetical protein
MNSISAYLSNPKPTSTVPAFAVKHFQLNRLLVPLVYFAILVGGAFIAYWEMFSFFAPYDDSGYFIHTIQLFTHGQVLYDRVFTEYGPFSYELWGAVFDLANRTISTDTGRLAVVGLRLFSSLLLGLSCQRLTGRLAIGVIVQVLSFSLLQALRAEPMHASGVVCLLFAITIAVTSFMLPGHRRAALLVLGALVAALTLTKVNLGGFAAIAVAYAAVMALPRLWGIAPLRWLAIIALVAISPLLMWGNLTAQWAQDYAILGVAGSLALVLATAPPLRTGASDGEEARRWTTWLLAGFGMCMVVVIGIILILGTSLGALFNETVVVPASGVGITIPIDLTEDVLYWAVGAVAAAWVVRRLQSGSARAHPGLPGALGRILAALAIWLSIVSVDPLNISPENANFALAMVLAWAAAIPSTRDDGSLQGRFARLFIPSLAVLEALMAYPAAGTQVMFGSLLFLVCGAICFADGWSDLEAWGAARRTGDGALAPRTIMSALATALAVAFTFQYIVRPLEVSGNAYAANQRLPIAGATLLRLPSEQMATFKQITTLLRARCRSVITLPGMFSFNLWSGLPAPSGLMDEPFWAQLSRAQERTALASAMATPGLCAVRNDQLAANWNGGKPPPQVPLVKFIEQDFIPVVQYGGYVVSFRRP